MFFGMCNSPATFQAMMDKIFKKEIEDNLIIVYMDNILAFSKTINNLEKIEQIVLKRHKNMIYILKPKNANSENQKSNILDLLLRKENWQWTQLNLKGYWNGLHQKQSKKYNPS
jgi:Reverse transcriptase (RNA-dependent DNA polymerase)